MRKLVINNVKQFMEKEQGLLRKEWKDIYFACPKETIHVSEVKYHDLNDEDLLRFLVHLILNWEGGIDRRLRATFHPILKFGL